MNSTSSLFFSTISDKKRNMGILFLLISILFVFFSISIQKNRILVIDHLLFMPSRIVGTLFLIFGINLFFVAARMKIAYAQFNYRIPYITALEAALNTSLSSLFFIPFLGAMAGQTFSFRKIIPPTASSLIYLYERGVMTVIGFFLAMNFIRHSAYLNFMYMK